MIPMLPIIIYDKAPEVGGRMLADYSRRAQPVFTTDQHGYGLCSFSLSISEMEMYQWYGWRNPWLIIWWQGVKLWEGRIERSPVNPQDAGRQQLDIVAKGGIRAFADLPYTALWSTTDVGGFALVTDQQLAGRAADKYRSDTTDRVYLSLTKNTVYTTGTDFGTLCTRVPGGAVQGVARGTCSYRVTLPANWVWRLILLNDNFSSLTVLDTNVATGALQTGTKSVSTIGTKPRFALEIYNNTGANYTSVAEDGTWFAELTNVRLLGGASTTLYADEIISGLITYVRSFNPNMLSPLTSFLQSPGVDLRNEVYADASMLDIIQRLLEYGDTSGRSWEFAVWENLRCFFRPRGSGGRTWAIDTVPAVDRDMERMHNSVYATYQDASGDDQRTATSTATEYVQLWGNLTRQLAISADTDSSAEAVYLRDTALLDERSGGAIGDIVVDRVYDTRGSAWPACLVRAGDTITVRALPVLGQDTNYVRRFIVAATSYDAATGMLTISPEARAPRYAGTEARRRNALGRS